MGEGPSKKVKSTGEGPSEKVRERRSVRKGSREKVHKRRFKGEGLSKKVHWRSSVEEGPRERVYQKRGMSMEKGQLERGLWLEKWL